MASKAFQRFKDRMKSCAEDMELADILVDRFRVTADSDQTLCEALGGDPKRHSLIHGRKNTAASRSIVAGHFRKTVQVAFVKDLHEDFSEYLATSLGRAALTGVDPNRYTGEVKIDIKAAELLAAGSWEAVVSLISNRIFRALENEKSTSKLIRKISDRLGLQLDEAILNEAMPYLDARHMLVHADGGTDEAYREAYPGVELDADNRIVINYSFVSSALTKVKALVTHVDKKFVENNLVPAQHLQGPAAKK